MQGAAQVDHVMASVRFAAFRAVRLVGTTLGLANMGFAGLQYLTSGTLTSGLGVLGIVLVALLGNGWFFTARTHRFGAATQVALVGLCAALVLHNFGFTVGTSALLIWFCVVAGIFYGSRVALAAWGLAALLLLSFVLRVVLHRLPDPAPYGAVVGPLDLCLRWSITTLTIAGILTAAVVAVVRSLEAATRELTQAHEREAKLAEGRARTRRLELAGRVAGGVAHDLNNLLTPVLTWASLLKESRSTDPDVIEASEAIATSATSAARLVKQLLAFSHAGTHPMSTLEVHGVLDAALALVRRTLDPAITVDVSLKAERSDIHGDALQLQTSFVALVLAAEDALPNGGTLFISTRVDGDVLELEVRDTGAGLTDEAKELLLDQALAGVLATVKHHAGHFDVESAPGKGTTFRLRLPLVAQRPVAAAPAPAPAKGPAGEVLVVDDEDMVRKVIVRLLTRRGFTCREAIDGRAAHSLWAQQGAAIRLIVTDSEMPNMTGRQLLAAVREKSPDLPVLFVSGYVKEGSIDALTADPKVRVLGKPFDPDRLLALVHELLAQA